MRAAIRMGSACCLLRAGQRGAHPSPFRNLQQADPLEARRPKIIRKNQIDHTYHDTLPADLEALAHDGLNLNQTAVRLTP